MSEYDVTPEGSRLIRRISIPDTDVSPCREGHIWDVPSDPGAPVACLVCGAERIMTRQAHMNLRSNLENLGGLD